METEGEQPTQESKDQPEDDVKESADVQQQQEQTNEVVITEQENVVESEQVTEQTLVSENVPDKNVAISEATEKLKEQEEEQLEAEKDIVRHSSDEEIIEREETIVDTDDGLFIVT